MPRSTDQFCQQFKALSDPNRLRIASMLTEGELCACIILEKLLISQPTLSHHMKILQDSGLVSGRKDGKWTHYSLNSQAIKDIRGFLGELSVADNPGENQTRCKEDYCE